MLNIAVKKGYSNLEYLKNDKSFEHLREKKKYEKIVNNMTENQ